MSNQKDVSTPLAEYNEFMEVLALPDALMGGTRAMRAAGKKFLPQETKEKDVAYTNRLNRSTLFNGYKRTVQYLSGQVFSKPVILGDDFPAEIEVLKNDADRHGNNIDVFSKKVFSAGVAGAVSHILVDMPPKTGAKTKAEEMAAGVRPYFVLVKSKDVIGWRTDSGGNLVQVRIKESKSVESGDYDVASKERIRVLEPGSYKVYEKNEKGEWFLFEEGTTSLDFIPIATFMPGEQKTAMTADPPLEDLAWLNLSHWQSQSDQRNILHVARVPLLFGKKLDVDGDGKIKISVSGLIHSDESDGDLKYVEHSGAAIDAGRQDLVDLEQRMALYGLQLLMPKTGDITATEKALDSAESDSTLKSWAIEFQDTLNTAISYAAAFMQQKDVKPSIAVNTDFRSMLHSLEPKVLLEAVREGVIAKELVFREFKRRGLVAETEDWQENLALIENEARSPGSFSGLASQTLR